jgi:hypothetical protein
MRPNIVNDRGADIIIFSSNQSVDARYAEVCGKDVAIDEAKRLLANQLARLIKEEWEGLPFTVNDGNFTDCEGKEYKGVAVELNLLIKPIREENEAAQQSGVTDWLSWLEWANDLLKSNAQRKPDNLRAEFNTAMFMYADELIGAARKLRDQEFGGKQKT